MHNYYYKYEFISAEPIYAEIREELSSYFNTGVVDDLMFPKWTMKALRKLSRGVLPIKETILFLEDFTSKLPPDFKYVKEARICTELAPISVRRPGAYYSQVITQVNPEFDRCSPCDPCETIYKEIIYKTNTWDHYTTSVTHLLTPGNLHARATCGEGCANLTAHSPNTFDVVDGKFQTNYRTGDVYLVYYAEGTDEEGDVMVPDNERIIEYVEAYIKHKIFTKLWNEVTDETFNQVERKYLESKQIRDEAWINADVETKKQTGEQKRLIAIKQANRFNRFNIR